MSNATRIAAIRIEDRHRKDFGDIASLAASIKQLGLLQPIVITTDLRLIAGERRIRACEQLGWETVPTRVVANLTEAADLLKAEADENTERKAFTPTEAESIAAAIEQALKPLAKERQGKRTDLSTSAQVGTKSEPRPAKAAASGTGFSAETIRKVRETKRVAESPATPEPVRQVAKAALTEMDRTGKVDGAHKQVKQALTAADYIAKYPDLDHYASKPEKVAALGRSLDGFDTSERAVRIDNLRKAIERERRIAENPPEPEIDYYAVAEPIFNAANHLSGLIEKAGGEKAIRDALADADPLMVTTWHDQFASLSTALAVLADATRPTLRRIK